MRWYYNEEYRSLFDDPGGNHVDILIVPHATNVTPVQGGPPTITSKVPSFNGNQPISGEYSKLDYIITNKDIVKEKFEYTNSINSSDNLTFSSCESAMVKFTIRNNKTWNEDDQMWYLDVPNLQKYEIWDRDRANWTTKKDKQAAKLIGECDAHAIFKLYFYFNGDSSNMIYMGMFMVEEDKVSNNGYEREITAYDFMTFLRDIDCFEWYKRLFDGVEATIDENGNRTSPKINPLTDNGQPDGKVKVKDALNNFFMELAFTTGKRTVTTPQNYDKDTITDAETGEEIEYPGPGLPIELDDDLFNSSATYQIPGTRNLTYQRTNPNTGQTETVNINPGFIITDNQVTSLSVERYGYMPFSKLSFYKDDKIIKSESLSFGKFLEDVGILAGLYPFIRNDYIVDGNYDFTNNKATTYEHCVLSFKPLPKPNTKTVDGETTETVEPENKFDNSNIVKGFKHDYYDVEPVYIFEIWGYNDKEAPMISYRYLTKQQQKDRKELMKTGGDLKTFRISNNVFTAYLDPTNEKHKAIISELCGNLTKYASYNDGIFRYAYNNMKYRTYTPYELQTYADPCRDPGDRIGIHYEDRITGEVIDCNSYILEMKLSGVQKMMGTYTAKGDMGNITFSDYKTSTKYSSSSYSTQSFAYTGVGGASTESGGGSGGSGKNGGDATDGISIEDFVEIIRNIGYRLLNEPGNDSVEYKEAPNHKGSIWQKVRETVPHDPEHYLFEECLTALADNSTTSTLSIKVTNVDTSQFETISYNAQTYDTVVYNDEIYTYGTDSKWHLIGYSGDDKGFGNACGDTLTTHIHDGDTTSDISYYHFNDNDELEKIDQEIVYGSRYEALYGTYVYLYPGFWWRVGNPYPYVDNGTSNFSGDDETPMAHYKYYTYYDYYDFSDELVNAKNASPGYPYINDNEDTWELNDAIADGSTQNPLVYTVTSNGTTETVESVVPIYSVTGYDEDSDDRTISDPTNYFIYGEDNEWHEHIINIIGDIREGDTVPEDLATGDSTNPILINDEKVTAEYGDYIINNNSTTPATGYIYIYPGIWYGISATGKKYPQGLLEFSTTVAPKPRVEIKWSDPGNITTKRPVKVKWDGTIVVRKENAPPKHRWDGTVIKNNKTKNKYKNTPLVDDTVKVNKTYFYGIFPYDDASPRHYRFTKVIRIDTLKDYYIPEILDVHMGAPGDWDGSEIAILYSGNSNKLTVQIASSHIVFKMYLGNVEIYSFTSPVGSTTSDVDKIHVSFLKDDTNEVAKPSFIYETGTNSYSYNQENPSASEMADIYTWLAG